MSQRQKRGNKGRQQNDLEQYMRDDMIGEEGNAEVDTRQRQRATNIIEEEEVDENAEYYNVENDQGKDKLKKENMDKISDILVTMIGKNKVNSKNAFDIPLPDVEKLTDFHQATRDTSWKKLSQTLDAGAKIYGFRVDSVHNEAYKVLGGLNRTELNQEEQQQEIDRRYDEDQDTQDMTIRKPRKEGDGEGTLEKHLHNIDTNKYDLEFDIDPLFQKTSAKFDEGGAKGLLLNNLCINEQLYLMFDSGNILDLAGMDLQQQKKAPITKGFFRDAELSSDILRAKLCPELITFKQNFLKDSKDFGVDAIQFDHVLDELQEDEDVEMGLRFENIDVNADQILNDLGAIVEGDYNEPQALENYHFPVDEVHLTGAGLPTNENSMTQNMLEHRGEDREVRELNFNSIEERLASLGFGQSLNSLVPDHKSWMGPELLKLKIKDKVKTKDTEKKQKRETKTKKKEQIPVDFNMSIKESWKDVFGVISTSRKKADKKSPQKSVADPNIKQAYLLPIDMQIKPFRLANLFSRGLHQGKGVDRERPVAPIKEDYDFGLNNTMDNMPYDQIDPDAQDEIQQNLSNIFGGVNRSEMQFDRPERFINIKILKEKMWNYLSDKLPTISIHDQNFDDNDEGQDEETIKTKKKTGKKKKEKDDSLTFTEVCKEIPSLLGDKSNSISVHSCFVTILHLANEKELRFKKEPLDFKIFKETSV